ncbi:MAG: hypothetical protein P4L33_00965 [Capsulimonadaceae bacterium]|nr:hypothetical protein [Capsulimonadaceae bacterium]
MTEQRMDKHGSTEARRLFESDTAQIGALGDIVEEHGGDNIVLVTEPSTGGADAGESDFAVEMNSNDPSDDVEAIDDEFPGEDVEDSEGIGETDLMGSAKGIARGFGSHLAQDIGSDGFQIEEIPAGAAAKRNWPAKGGELDDYDDNKTSSA